MRPCRVAQEAVPRPVPAPKRFSGLGGTKLFCPKDVCAAPGPELEMAVWLPGPTALANCGPCPLLITVLGPAGTALPVRALHASPGTQRQLSRR